MCLFICTCTYYEYNFAACNCWHLVEKIGDICAAVPCVRQVESQTDQISCTTLQTVNHRFNVYASSCVALVLCRGDGHCKLVTRFGVIRECNKRFGFV